jgi:hypothetical protein
MGYALTTIGIAVMSIKNSINVVLSLAILGGGGAYYYYQEVVPCRNPILYDVGTFDSRFGISKEKFIKTIGEAETIWESKTHHDLFKYSPGSKFKINLVFDDREKSTQEATQSKEQIGSSRAQYDALLAQYKALTISYEAELSTYNSNLSAFDTRLNAYNARVAEANASGGATPKEYQELEAERKSIESTKQILDRERLVLNGKASELNSLGENVNALAKQLNIEVDLHNERFGEAKEFDQGDYQGNRINIYQFDGIGDLRLVLAHELGHALGLNHVQNPTSVMYYLMEKQNIQNPSLTAEDLTAVNDVCNF